MFHNKQPTARFEVYFAKPILVRSLFQMLSRAPDFAWNLVRGRVTRTDARYELELSGSAKVINTILSRCERPGVRIRTFEAVPR